MRDGSGNITTPWTITYNQVVYPPAITLFTATELAEFRGDVRTFQSDTTIPYKDTPKLSNSSTSFYTSLQFLETPIVVRVSKPLVSNIAGGTAYLGHPIGYDINTVADNFYNNLPGATSSAGLSNGNFVTTAVNGGAFASGRKLSSATKSVDNDTAINTIIASGSDLENTRIIQSSKNALSGI